MEQSQMKEILKALELHSEHIDNKLNNMESDLKGQMNNLKSDLNARMGGLEEGMDGLQAKMDAGFKRVDKRLDRLEKKVDGYRVELTETQETVDFLSSKSVQHEKKLRNLQEQQS